MKYKTNGEKIFEVFNYMFLTATAVLCIVPVLNLLAVSFSSTAAISAGKVGIWPVDFNTQAYKYLADNSAFLHAMGISAKRLVLGVTINMLLCILTAYPLSKDKDKFKRRNFFANYLVITMLIGGGLIPTYMIVSETGLINSIWALILPTAVPVYNVILLQNFYRGIPTELEEAAFIDGAGIWRTLWSIYVPLSKPALASILLFIAVDHWNAWFDGLIYMNDISKYPLQSYLQTIIVEESLLANKSAKEMELFMKVSARNLNAAQVFVAMIPIVIVYPFLQKYFTSGLVLGSVKG